jgi:hypothetical protein
LLSSLIITDRESLSNIFFTHHGFVRE